MRWSSRIIAVDDCLERDWLGVARPHPCRVIAGQDRPGAEPFHPQAARDEYCIRCGASVGPGEFIEGKGCGACVGRRFPWSHVVRLGRYDGDLRDWVHEIKFRSWDAMGVALGRLLGESLLAEHIDAQAIVPVPASRWRRWRRGIDHSRLIAGAAANVLHLPMVRAMKRLGRPPQRAVPPSQRRDNVRGAFSVTRLHNLQGCTVILVDDVSTTRATLTEASRTLRRDAQVADVICAVLSVAEPDRRGRSAPDAVTA